MLGRHIRWNFQIRQRTHARDRGWPSRRVPAVPVWRRDPARLQNRSLFPPRNATTESKDAMPHIYYSDKYYDDKYEYRHVVLPKEMVKLVPRTHLLSEQEWRAIGVQQSQGWVHYMIHEPEPHILLFKRKITTPLELRGEEN